MHKTDDRMVPVLRNKASKFLHVPKRGAIHVDILSAIFNLLFTNQKHIGPFCAICAGGVD